MPVRILLAAMPRMLFDMISEIILAEPEFSIIEDLAESNTLATIALRASADVVIGGNSLLGNSRDLIPVLASIYPAKLLALGENGRGGSLYELHAHCEPIGELSAQALVAKIRAAAGHCMSRPS